VVQPTILIGTSTAHGAFEELRPAQPE